MALSVGSVLLVALVAYPVIAGDSDKGSTCGASRQGLVASVDAQGSCGAKAAVAAKEAKSGCGSCGSKQQEVASVEGKSCSARKHQGQVVLRVDAAGQDAKAKGDCCGKCPKAKAESCGMCAQAKAEGKCPNPVGKRLQGLMAHLDHVEKALNDGHKDKAMEHLALARKSAKQVAHHLMHADPEGHAHAKHEAKQAQDGKEEARFANKTCPIMGKQIQAAKVPEKLTRQFQGKTVAFCCGGCPRRWDQLSADEKASKLADAK
jgi:hypothetical protein